MNVSALDAAATPQSVPCAPTGQAGGAQVTRVSLVHVERRISLALRFGEPDSIIRFDAPRRVAVFLPGAMFCRLYWRFDISGAVRRQLLVMQACTASASMQRVPGVQPGARVLLQAGRPRPVRAVLACIDAIEALGIAPEAAAPLYWVALTHRLARHLPLPAYTVEQHALWRAGRSA